MSNKDSSDETSTAGNDGRPRRLETAAALEDFRSEAGVALVEFVTEGCGICASMEPVLTNLAREADVRIGVINPRNDPPLIETFEVKSVPLFVLFVDGKPIARKAEGFVSGDDLSAWITEHVTEHAGDGATHGST